MTKKKKAPSASKKSFNEMVFKRTPYVFEFEEENYYMDHPTTEEYDDALFIQSTVMEGVLSLPEVKELSGEKSEHEVFSSKSDEVAISRSLLARDRYLTYRLLCTEDGVRIYDPDNQEDVDRWDLLPMDFKDTARVTLWGIIADLNNAPKELAHLLKPRSELQNVSGNGLMKTT